MKMKSPIRQRWDIKLLEIVLFVSLMNHVQIQASTNFGQLSSPLPITSENLNFRQEICQYVLQILHSRYESVLNGERSRQFSRAYNFGSDTLTGSVSIVSAHGIDIEKSEIANDKSSLDRAKATLNNQTTSKAEELKQITDCILQNKSPINCRVFPSDLTSLRLPHDELNRSKYIEPTVSRLIIRAIRLSFNFSPCILTAWLAYFSSTFRSKIWYKLLGNALSRSGPAFIKWGQWSSTRPDMFPTELCDAFTDLHADAPSHSWKFTQKTVEKALSIPSGSIYQIFDYFGRKPIASGSIAQVHRAILHIPACDEHCNNEKNSKTIDQHRNLVAVKVRHPKVAYLLDLDFRLMSILASFVDKIPSLSWLNVKASIEQFSHTMAAQADLDVEAHHLEVLNHNFRKWKRVGFPKPIFASESVIIETFEKGTIVTDMFTFYDNVLKGNDNQNDYIKRQLGDVSGVYECHDLIPLNLAKFIVTTGLGLYLKMMIVDGLMHADLHPGNILLRIEEGETGWEVGEDDTDRRREVILEDDTKRNVLKAYITLVDAGMVAKLTPEESNNFIGLLVSLGEGNALTASKSVLNFSKYGDDEKGLTTDQKKAFTDDMIELFKEVCKGYGTNMDFGEALRGVLNLIRIHKVRIDANYATLVVNALCLHSMAYKLAPEYNVLDASKPFFDAYSRLCADEACSDSKVRRKHTTYNKNNVF